MRKINFLTIAFNAQSQLPNTIQCVFKTAVSMSMTVSIMPRFDTVIDIDTAAEYKRLI